MISVLIVNYFCHTLTARAVRSVLSDDPSAQIIVVDNSNDQAEAENLRRVLPDGAKLTVPAINRGFGRACNLAFEQAIGEWILLLNPDAFILPGCLQQLVKTLQRHPRAAAVSPLALWDEAGSFLLPPGQMQSPGWEWMQTIGIRLPVLGRWLSRYFRTYALRCLNARRPVQQAMLSGGHMFLRRSAIDGIGGFFDPVFFMYYEDTDLCRRLTDAGFELLLDPAAKAVHQWRHDPAKSQYADQSRAYYMRKHFRWVWLKDKLRRKFEQLLPPKIEPFHDLGICPAAPIFDLPNPKSGDWLLELSPHPLLIPAAVHRSNEPPVSISSSVWSLLGPARYWVRITSPCGQSRIFTWEIPNPEANLQPSVPQEISHTKRFEGVDLAHVSDESLLLTLFQAAFGHEMPAKFWRWKYHGLDILGTLMRQNNSLVAFYGGMPRAIRLFGTPATAVQIGDVMVHPQHRGILTRRGPFFLTATHFLESFVGRGKPYPVAFGFPAERAYRLAAQLGLYVKVGELVCVSWPALQARPSYKVSIRPLPGDSTGTINWLWSEMAEALQDQIVGVRDGEYVQRRYRQHPCHSYEPYLVSSRLTGLPLGIIVIRIGDDAVELVDIIAPPHRMEMLTHCLHRLAWSLKRPRAYAWITSQNAHFLSGDAGEITPTGIIIPHNAWTPSLSMSEVANRWWLMGGDTDFR